MTELLDTLQRWFVSLPHCATLGFEFIGVEDGKPTLKVNYRDDLVGNGSNGVIHGGVITSLVDTTSALSVFSHLDSAEARKEELAWSGAGVYGGRRAQVEVELLDALTRFSARAGRIEHHPLPPVSPADSPDQ